MNRVTIFLSALLFLVCLTTNTLAAATEVKLLASDGDAGDEFGRTISISGDYAIVGARYADGAAAKSGAAYIYYFDGVNWIEQQKLIASDGAYDDKFGASVSISGNYAFVGAVYGDGNVADSGAVYIYYFDGTNWVEQQKLVNNNGTIYAYFGRSVSISGNYAIICESNSSQLILNLGVAFIYYFDGTNWVEQQQLTTSDGAEGFCIDGVDISGNHAIVGAKQDDVNGQDSGSAYVFFYDGTSWSEQQKLLPSEGYERDWFGYAISISGNYAVIGKPSTRIDGNGDHVDPGSAYVFHYDGTNWSEQQKLIAYDGELGDYFGNSAAMSGDNVIVGAYFHDSGGLSTAGAAYIFHNNGTNWISAEKLVATDGAASDRFGISVSISNNKAIVGAFWDDDNGSNSGSAYIYTDYSTEQVVVDIDNDGYVLAVDCNDRDASVNPGEPEVCNDGKDTDCDGLADINDPDCPPDVDVDNDGYGSIYDCNDNNASVNPGASEDAFGVCSDGLDNECDGLTDLMEPACSADNDFDGYPVAEDCDDDNGLVNTGTSEDNIWVCGDMLDNDCDGLIDQDPECLIDNDGDGHPVADDCNDNDDSVYWGAEEVCTDGIDNDCDNLIDAQDPDAVGCSTTTTTTTTTTTSTSTTSTSTTTTLPSTTTCADIMDKETCNADPNCEWSGNPKNGTCQDAIVCVPDETPEATCTDGVDNDCDGLTDCADTADCGGDPACQGGSCDTYTDKTSCQSNGCTWSNKDKVCM